MSILVVVGAIVGAIALLLFALMLWPFVTFRMRFLKRNGRPATNAEVDAWAATWMGDSKR